MTLTVDGNILWVKPWRTCLEGPLTCRRFLRDRRFQRNIVQEEQLFVYDPVRKLGQTYAGLLDRIVTLLKKRGVGVVVDDHRPSPPSPDWSKINVELRYGQPEVLAALAASQGGVIKAPTAFGKTFVLEQFCRIYPSQNILLVAHSLSALNSMKRRIVAANPGRAILTVSGESPFRPGPTVCICSSKSLHKIPWDWPNLLFFDEVHVAAAPEISVDLTRFVNSRRFGLSASPKGRSDKAELLIEALFGPVLIDVPYAEAQKHGSVSPMMVFMIKADGPDLTTFRYDSAKERYGLWRNDLRNRLIAAVARSLGDEQVLVMVAKTEHALFLKRLLPDYALLYSEIDEERAMDFRNLGIFPPGTPNKIDDASLQAGFRSGKIRHVIATTKWSTAVDFPKLCFLVRADGQAGTIPAVQIGGRLSRVSEGKPLGVIFDFFDDFGFESRSYARITHYRNQGWTVQRGELHEVAKIASLMSGVHPLDSGNGEGGEVGMEPNPGPAEAEGDFMF